MNIFSTKLQKSRLRFFCPRTLLFFSWYSSFSVYCQFFLWFKCLLPRLAYSIDTIIGLYRYLFSWYFFYFHEHYFTLCWVYCPENSINTNEIKLFNLVDQHDTLLCQLACHFSIDTMLGLVPLQFLFKLVCFVKLKTFFLILKCCFVKCHDSLSINTTLWQLSR